MTSSCSSPYASSMETTNYARICRIVVDVLRDILWQVLAHAIPPADLPIRVQTDIKKLGKLDAEIKTWLCGISPSSSEIPIAEKFDVSSLYTLIRNLCVKVPAPSTQWGQIPPPTGTTLGDDIERVRAFRNSFYGHAKQAKVDTTYFNNQCKNIKTVVSRFDIYFRSHCNVKKCDFKSEIDTILICSMDKSLEDDYIDKMNQIAILSDDLKQEVNEVRQQVGEVKHQVDDVKKSLEIFQNTVDVFQKGSMEKAEDSLNCLSKIQETLEKIVMEKDKDKLEGMNGSLINKEQDSQLEKENAGISHEPSQSTKQKVEKRKIEDRELGSAPTWNFKLEDIRKVWQSIEGVLPEELSPKYLLDVFIEEGILSPDECQDLRKKKRREMSKDLLQTVKDNLPDAFLVLLKALKKDGEDKVIDMLTKIIDGNNVVEGTAPVTGMSCYSVEISLKKYGKTVLRTEQAITDTLKNAAGGLIDELCAVLNDVKSGSVIIHLQPLSKHAWETLKLFCQNGRMKTFVLGLLKKRNIFATLPAGIICIDVQICCQKEDHSEGAYDCQRDLIPEQFEVVSYPQVIKVNLLLHYGSLLEEIEPIHLKKTFIDRGILVESFFQELKMLRRRERVCLFLNKILDTGSVEALVALVDALKDSGDEDLASKLCCVETKTPLLGDTDIVDDSLVEVVEATSKICVEEDVLWSCHLEVMINKNDNGKEEDMAHSLEEGFNTIFSTRDRLYMTSSINDAGRTHENSGKNHLSTRSYLQAFSHTHIGRPKYITVIGSEMAEGGREQDAFKQTVQSTSNEPATMIKQETNTATLEANTSTMTQVPEKTTISTMFTTTESTVVPATNMFSTQPPVSASSTVASISSKTVIPTTSSEADAISTSTQYATSPSAATSDTTKVAPITTMLTASFNGTTEQIISSTMVEPNRSTKEAATLSMPETSTTTMTEVSTTTISTMATSTDSTDVPTTVTTAITTTSPTHLSITTSITVATPSSTMVISTESDTTSTTAQSAVTPTSTAQPTTTATNEITKAAITTSQTASSSEMTGSEIAEGGREQDAFKLTLKVEVIAETKLNQDAITKVKNYLQENLTLLQRYLQEAAKHQYLHLKQIKKFKKGDLGFELLIFSSDQLDQIKTLTTERQLDKALSAFSVEHGLHHIAGLDPTQGPGFICKLEDFHFHEGKLFFSKKSSDSEEDEEEEVLQDKQESLSVTEVRESASDSAERNEARAIVDIQGEEVHEEVNHPEPSVSRDENLPLVHKGHRLVWTAQNVPVSHESDTFRSSSDMYQKSSSSGPLVQVSHQPSSSRYESFGKSSWPDLRFWKWGKSQSKTSEKEDTCNIGPISGSSEIAIEKKLYLFLPTSDEEIKEVFLTSKDYKELTRLHLNLVSNTDCLWELSLPLHQSMLKDKITCQFGFSTKRSKTSGGKAKLDRKFEISDSSVQRIMWGETTYGGVLTHMKHILHTSSQDVKGSFMQMEELADVALKNLGEKEKILNGVQKELSDTHTVLMFAVIIAKFSNDSNIEVILNKLSNEVFNTLFKAICSSAEIADVPSTSVEHLKRLSYWVIKRYCGKKFCLVMWMKYTFPIHNEKYFLSRLKDIPVCNDDETSVELLNGFCKQIRERILRQESQGGEDLLLAIFRKVHLFIGLKLYHQVFEDVYLQKFVKNLKDFLSSEISTYASQLFKREAIGELKDLWSIIRKENFDSEFRLEFETFVLNLMNSKINLPGESLNQDWCTLCEDEVLFVFGKNQQTLLESICRSNRKEMHNHLIRLANLEKFKKALDFDAVQLWFQTAIDSHVHEQMTEFNLMQFYCYLCDALMLLPSRTQNEENRLEAVLFTKECTYGIKPSELLKRRNQIVGASRNARLVSKILNHHVKSLLRQKDILDNPGDIIHEVCQNHLVSDEWQVDIVEFLLEQYEPKVQSEQDMFMSMISIHGFWKAVMEIQGKFSPKVRSLNVFQLADKSIKFVQNMFINLTVSLKFLKDIVSNKMENKVEALILTAEFTKEKFVAVLEEYKRELPKEEQKKEIVKSTLQNVLKYCPEAKDSGVLVIKNASDTVGERLMNGQISLLEMKSLWHPYKTLPDICRDLFIPVQSKVFWKKWNEGKKVDGNGEKNQSKQSAMDCSDVEQRIYGDDVEGQDDAKMIIDVCDMENTPGSHGGLTFLESLSRTGCHMYRNIWSEFFCGKDLLLSTIQEVFSDVKDIQQEIELVENYVHNKLNMKSNSALMSYFNFSKYENTVTAMVKSISAFNINIEDDEEFNSAAQAFENLTSGQASNITLFEVHDALATVKKTAGMLDNNEEAVALLNALGKSSTLISFLTEIVEEDIRNLIDAVEEVSENYVKESTVSGLIEVKRFLHPFLTKDSKLRQNRTVFFTEFSKKFKESVFKDAVGKTTDCMDNLHGLKSLYKNLANRSERIIEIIQNIVQHGTFKFCLSKHVCVLTVFYLQSENESQYSTATLVDLRNRALLLMNTPRKEDSVEKSEETNEYLKLFVQFINNGLEIAELYTSLHVSGHFKYMEFSEQVEPVCLNDFRLQLEKKLAEWQTDIMHCREMHYYMNFLHGFQIQLLYSYLETGTIKDTQVIDSFLKFIHPNTSIVGIQKFYMSLQSDKSNLSVLMNMGIALEHICKHLTPIRRPMESSDSGIRKMESVQKGKLLIASLPEDSKLVIKTVLGLYQNNSKAMPEAHQVLFCHPETTWDEVDLLLKRCLGAHQFGRDESLFCLANVEILPNEKQFQLVDALRKLPKNGIFLLTIVFRGAEYQPFLHEFSDCVIHVSPMTDHSFQRCLQSECPKTFTVTSNVPGLGKTESIKRYAHQKKKNCVTLHISGPQSKQTLVERLSKLKVQKNDVLHIDIGNVPNPEEMDTFLFELLVLHYASAYTASFFLTTDTACIEIANTMNNILCDSLHIASSFERKHLKWEGFNDLIISSELHSSVQVVCLYLDALENGTLDKKDIVFKGTKALKPLPSERCKQLLQKALTVEENDLSYNLINTFVRVLADQLKKMSSSSYFRISNLSEMLGRKGRPSVKTALVKEMVAVSIIFASRSVKSCRESQVSSIAPSEQNTKLKTSQAEQVDGMIRWEDSNHLMFLFHSQDIQTLSALYRDIKIIPDHIKTLFESQMKKKLPDFSMMNQKTLQDILQKITRSNPKCLSDKELQEMAKYYVLTPDNLLKMVLIVLRVRAHIPVIVMGETGCGKTSLIDYISKLCEAKLTVKSIHSGIKEEDIINTVTHINEEAKLIEGKRQIWLFLDEINTNDHLWLISDIICHHSCLGRKLAPNLVLMAACNPYRLRSESSIHTAGLEGKARTDEMSRLFYRVHSLPETMVDYVWDFGSLSTADEKMYICQMVCGKLGFSKEKEQLFADAIVISQEFIRTEEGVHCCVSLRDVRRCTDLVMWFKEILNRKKKLKQTSHQQFYSKNEVEIRSIILALAHCYHSRLLHSVTRTKYREVLYQAFKDHLENEYKEKKIIDVIREEQKDILDRMELPVGIAKNTALQENVFVILVSILNRIPIFVVGKPGCSKSLSMQVIRSNLRGPDSKDELFRTFPQLYCVSFQGSESSTSEGIEKVVNKAKKYQHANAQEDVLSVVILDEIGLAEESRFNPLGVLHSLLEPIGKPRPDVAVVGISNWALDASKMNRAIHLSRPEMDEEELYDTGKSISDSLAESSNAKYSRIISGPKRELDIHEELQGIARGYLDFVENQRFRNFFGLRDYYSLVKYFANELYNLKDDEIRPDTEGKIMLKGIQRNFGGLSLELGSVRKYFAKHIKVMKDLKIQSNVPVLDLIKENIEDRFARHLLLITSGDSVLGILEKQLRDLGREHTTIFGSKFEEDRTDEYSYQILSRIILCMEQGLVLILKDLENVYGSLYDMLNQNYTMVGNRKNCRIALGPYSNPMCSVHDDFKCIVLVEESKLDYSDPPFLNRFEKQRLHYSEILGAENDSVVSELQKWICSVSSIPRKHFSCKDIFPIYSKDMTSSLVLQVSSRLPVTTHQARTEACKMMLLEVMKPEAIVRLAISEYGQNHSKEEMEKLKQSYFSLPIHDGLERFIKSEIGGHSEGIGKLLVVFTNSNIHTDLKKLMPNLKGQIEKLGAIKSEKQLMMQMEQFWQSSEKELLFLQCKADSDGVHILLSKSITEKLQSEYGRKDSKIQKHVCLIVHLGRNADESKTVPQIDFLAKWRLVMIDSLERPRTRLPQLSKLNLMETIELKRPLDEYIKEQLFAAFACIRYGTSGRSIESISEIISKIGSCPEFLSYLEISILKWINARYSHSAESDVHKWQVQVSCDVNALYTASSLIEALERHILSVIYKPLAMLIYELEKQNLLDCFFVSDSSVQERRHMWNEFFSDEKMFTIGCPLPTGPECYELIAPVVKLHMPFSKLLFERVDAERDSFNELLRDALQQNATDEIEDLDIRILESLYGRFSEQISKTFGECQHLQYKNCQMDYVHDFCTLILAKYSPENISDERINVMYWLLTRGSDLRDSIVDACAMVHITYWTSTHLIMAEFMLIETCRELVDIEDILQEICSPNTNRVKNKEDEISFDFATDKKEDVENGICTEESVVLLQKKNAFPKQISVDNKPDKCETNDITANNDQKEIQENASTLQNILLYKLCKKILPREKNLQSIEDLEQWNKKGQSILSLAVRVSKECSVVFALRFCTDLTAHILIPYKMDSFWLVEFGNMLQRDISMHSEEFLKKVTELLIFLHSTGVTIDDQQKIFSQFVLRSLQSSDSRDILDWLFKMVKEERVPDSQLSHLKSSLHYATSDVPQSTLFHIIDVGHEDYFELLHKNKNEILFKLDSSIGIPWEPCWQDHPLAAIMVDIFENKIFESQLDMDETQKLDLAIKRLDKVERMIFEDNFSLKHLLGIAYYRQFIKGIALALPKKASSLQTAHLQNLDACLKSIKMDKHHKRLSTQLFLLKLLKSRFRFPRFHKECHDLSSKLTFIASLWKCGSPWRSIDSAPLALYDINLHKAATDALMRSDVSKDELQHFIEKAVSNCDQMLSLHSVLMQHYYLKKTVSEVTDSEKTKANDLQKLCSECELDEFNLRLIKCHLGLRDYERIDVLDLNVHEGMTDSDMQISSFVVELASLASSFSIGYKSCFVECVHHPEELCNVFLPGLDVQDAKYELIQPAFENEETFVGRCINHHRFAVSNCKVTIIKCPVCTGENVEIKKPLSIYSSSPACDGTIHGRNLTAISQRILQMIIHGLFTASLSLGYCKANDLSKIIKSLEKEEDVAKYLYENIQDTFSYLESLMGLSQTDLDYFLHVLLVRTRNLIWENVSSFNEESERDGWEKEFNKVIKSLVKERFIAVQDGKRQVLAFHKLDENSVERQIEEVDKVGWCPCLFRLTMEPSLENLSLELYEGNKADSFPFLALVLKALPQLELIQHIKPLISWHKACVLYASYRKKKADFKKSDYTVSDFIHEEDDQNRREYLKRKFESCKIAWEAIRKKAILLKLLSVMDRIHDMSTVGSCMILDKTSPMYNVIEILISMQNNFLDESLALSSKKYFPALHFLHKNTACACIPCTPVADANKGDIIIFQWSERYLKSSQCNIRCGQGREINYDFRTIEMELANSLLSGKCYLLLKESFPEIIFTDEWYKRYILMIQELKKLIPQNKLTSDIETGLKSNKDKDPKLIADFLAHLGVVISLLRRTGGKPDTPLVQFLDKWNNLARPFPRQVLPSPESAIELCHIAQVNELLEDLDADGIIDSLEDEYRAHLGSSFLNSVDGFLGKSVMRVEVVLKAEKRFVSRCLLHRDAAPEDSLLNYLQDSYFWPEGSLHDGKLEVGSPSVLLVELFPSDVQVQHIHFYIQHLIKRIKDLKSEDRRISDGTGFSSTGKITNKNCKKKQQRGFYLDT